VGQRQIDDATQRGGRVLPGARRHASDVELLHLEELPRRGERGVGLLHRHRRCVLAGGAHGLFSLLVPPPSKIEERSTRARPRSHGCPGAPGGRPSSSGRLVDVGAPAPAELLEGRHVDRAVVEVVLDLGELGGQEAPVRPDRVPRQGTVRGSFMCCFRKASVWAPASARLSVDDSISASRPERVCMVRTKSSMPATSSGVACTTRSGPSSTRARSSSVTRQAISTMV